MFSEKLIVDLITSEGMEGEAVRPEDVVRILIGKLLFTTLIFFFQLFSYIFSIFFHFLFLTLHLKATL